KRLAHPCWDPGRWRYRLAALSVLWQSSAWSQYHERSGCDHDPPIGLRVLRGLTRGLPHRFLHGFPGDGLSRLFLRRLASGRLPGGLSRGRLLRLLLHAASRLLRLALALDVHRMRAGVLLDILELP